MCVLWGVVTLTVTFSAPFSVNEAVEARKCVGQAKSRRRIRQADWKHAIVKEWAPNCRH